MATISVGRVVCSGEVVCRHVVRPRAIQLRTFSNSSAHQKRSSVPTFTEVSSPDLGTILTELREKVILPSYLGKGQKALVFKGKHKKTLEAEPVNTIIDDEEFNLKHLDRTKDLPPARRSLYRALKLMDKDDLKNLPGLLIGLQRANVLNDLIFKQVVRTAVKKGRIDMVLECVRRAEETGMFIQDREMATTIFHSIWLYPYKANWGVTETRKALSTAEQLSILLEDPKHAGSRQVATGDPRAEPAVIGILLDLAATRALRHLDGKGSEGKVALYAERLVGVPFEYQSPPADNFLLARWLSTYIPLLNGVKLAQSVLGSTSMIAQTLGKRSSNLEKELASAAKEVSASRTSASKGLGIEMYNNMLGKASN